MTSKPHNLTTSRPQDLKTPRPHNLTTSQPHNLTTSQPYIRLIAILTFTAMALLVALVLFSWIASITSMELNVRSLLSADGLRWLFGSFTEGLCTTLLVWGLLLSVGLGAVRASGLHSAVLSVLRRQPLLYRARVALWTALGIAAVIFVVYGLMAFVPHAVLLSITGELLNSPFSAGLLPVVSLVLVVASVVFGLQSGKLDTAEDVFLCLSYGPVAIAPLIPLYIAATTLWNSVCYVFSL